MKKSALFYDYVSGEIIEGPSDIIATEARERKNEDYKDKNLVLGRDFIENHTCYYLRETTRELSRLDFERDIHNYLTRD